MEACWCSLSGTKACMKCTNNTKIFNKEISFPLRHNESYCDYYWGHYTVTTYPKITKIKKNLREI